MTNVLVVVHAYSGNVKPFRAVVFVNGKFAGRTGFCKTDGLARQAAGSIIAKKADSHEWQSINEYLG